MRQQCGNRAKNEPVNKIFLGSMQAQWMNDRNRNPHQTTIDHCDESTFLWRPALWFDAGHFSGTRERQQKDLEPLPSPKGHNVTLDVQFMSCSFDFALRCSSFFSVPSAKDPSTLLHAQATLKVGTGTHSRLDPNLKDEMWIDSKNGARTKFARDTTVFVDEMGSAPHCSCCFSAHLDGVSSNRTLRSA